MTGQLQHDYFVKVVHWDFKRQFVKDGLLYSKIGSNSNERTYSHCTHLQNDVGRLRLLHFPTSSLTNCLHSFMQPAALYSKSEVNKTFALREGAICLSTGKLCYIYSLSRVHRHSATYKNKTCYQNGQSKIAISNTINSLVQFQISNFIRATISSFK